ncbi:hypothetical protein FEE59_20375 [Herbaspirillum sp. RU 5E]|uniref:hypothetical protein n=1 Tax=Herbaspirillum sp. CAH-3 TaxID=2605746 RepID=UPI0012ACCF7E|nr:hypothetical protein [Herbaspirillum sp. CAH-3]MBW9335875.1 hypothetical protein [Herbaspirillum sp. RU 5E]MRT31751.1 hypothetical protein [Herbaspirillum sp. CAH-3]
MSQDNGNWLSAEQAVMPDGSERHNLPLVNRKLPQLSPQQAGGDAAAAAPEATPQAPATPSAAS